MCKQLNDNIVFITISKENCLRENCEQFKMVNGYFYSYLIVYSLYILVIAIELMIRSQNSNMVNSQCTKFSIFYKYFVPLRIAAPNSASVEHCNFDR